MQKLTRRKAIIGSLGIGAAALAGCVSGADDPNSDDDGDDGEDDNGDNGDNAGDGPEPETSIEQFGSDCAGQDSESVAVYADDGVYLLPGTLPAPTPCHEAVLDSTAYEDGTLSVTVDVAEVDENEACVDCHGKVDYEVTVEGLDSADVETVEITHATGETHTVEADEFREGRPKRLELVDAEITESSSEVRDEKFEGSNAELDEIPDGSDSGTGTIEIEGMIPTDTPHYEAVLEDAAVQGTQLRMAVGVESTLEDGEMGTEPLGAVRYTATIELRNPGKLQSFQVAHPQSSHGGAWESDSASASSSTSTGSESGDDSE